MAMKRLMLAAFLLLVAVPMFAVERRVVMVDEVLKMSKAGVGDDEIIAFVHKSREPYDVSGDDVIAMTDAHVSPPVIKAVIDASSDRMREQRSAPRTRVVYSGWYDPFYYSYRPYYYDPFFYGPRFYVGFGRYYGGFHRFRRW